MFINVHQLGSCPHRESPELWNTQYAGMNRATGIGQSGMSALYNEPIKDYSLGLAVWKPLSPPESARKQSHPVVAGSCSVWQRSSEESLAFNPPPPPKPLTANPDSVPNVLCSRMQQFLSSCSGNRTVEEQKIGTPLASSIIIPRVKTSVVHHTHEWEGTVAFVLHCVIGRCIPMSFTVMQLPVLYSFIYH